MSQPVRVELGERSYDVHVSPEGLELTREGVLARAGLEADLRTFCLTDTGVARHHGPTARRLASSDDHMIVVEAGERAKSFASLEAVLDRMIEAEATRRDVLVAFGGGVVGDLGGLAASVCLRGIELIQVPTTLLAQVDSSVGGKTAVNLSAGKNLAGTYHHPRAVLVDTTLLATLPDRDYRCGLGEVVKYGLLAGEGLFEELEAAAGALVARDADTLAAIVPRCLAHKARVVSADERDGGARMLLNAGHTVGHALEHMAPSALSHGEAVGLGLLVELEVSRRLGALEDPSWVERTRALLEALGLPVHHVTPAFSAVAKRLRADKKRLSTGGIPCVLFHMPAVAEVRQDVPETVIEESLTVIHPVD